VRFRGRSRCNCGAAEYAALRCNVHRANEREIARRTGVTRERRGRDARRGRVPDFANGRTPRRLAKRGLANSADLDENPGDAGTRERSRPRGQVSPIRGGKRLAAHDEILITLSLLYWGKFAFN